MVTDFIIIGSGLAGLYSAWLASKFGSVLLITKSELGESNSRYAQGGIAAALGPTDSPAIHARDTLAAGAGLCEPEAVKVLVEDGPACIADLIQIGVPFDRENGEVSLGQEGAHSVPRIVHAGGDATGRHVEATLSHLVRESQVTILEQAMVTELLIQDSRVVGVSVLDCRTNLSTRHESGTVILATGGCGQLYRITTNPALATGDGVALAFRAGAEVVDLEFVQFHPTALTMPGVRPFLISEAVRGEGARLLDINGRRFMTDYADQAELAPRDVVARAITAEMTRTSSDHVFLDVTGLPNGRARERFPTIYEFCLAHDIDISRDLIPVAPAAHYMMGGVRTNLWGETTLAGLYAAGECAWTGVHGANRLASNSLLEALVFSRRVIQRIKQRDTSVGHLEISSDARALSNYPGHSAGGIPRLADLQDLMWNEVGVTRDQPGLSRVALALTAWRSRLPDPVDRDAHELANLILLASITTEAALAREESRGAHFRTDFPAESESWRRHLTYRQAAV